MSYASLTTVSTAAWLAKDLASAGTFPVWGFLGLDMPPVDGKTAFWCSGAFAMRMMRSGSTHPFLSVGSDWLSRVPEDFLGRVVRTGKLADLTDSGPGFYKLSEHKHALIPASLRPDGAAFRAAAAAAMPSHDISGLSVTFSDPMVYRREFRCFIAHGFVVAASFYLSVVPGANGLPVEITWDAFSSADKTPPAEDAARFAQLVVDAMGRDQPAGYTLDVGEDSRGRFTVIEANAAWSSNIYHAEPAGVIESVLASQDPKRSGWLWTPDALFLSRTRPLPGY